MFKSIGFISKVIISKKVLLDSLAAQAPGPAAII